MMAKKQAEKVRCVDCKFSPGVIIHLLVECNNEEANPGGFKKGCWDRVCPHFKRK